MQVRTPEFYFVVAFIASVLYACSSTRSLANKERSLHLKFLSEYDLPYNAQFQHTIIGGLSGIDYDKGKNIFYIITDDRSERNDARFYKAKIFINNYKIDSIAFIETIFLKNRVGDFYPGPSVDPYHTPDPEAIRYNPINDTYVWSNEGERLVRKDNVILEDPAITEINSFGNYIDTFLLPSQLHMNIEEAGPRRNSVFEGLTFSNDYKALYASVEEPLYNDGPRAGLHDSAGIIRIIKFDAATRKELAQYAYMIDGVEHAPNTPGAFIINGVADILSVEQDKLFVVERSYSAGRLTCTIKIFLADLSTASNIREISSLIYNPVDKIAKKKLLLNMDDLDLYIDNIEGLCFGPDLPNGNKTLIFVSDNNFMPIQKTQFLLFEIEENDPAR